MSFRFIGNPTLVLKYSTPKLKERSVVVQTAQWEGDAKVEIKNEHGKKWRIGFAQLLEKNMMQAIYTKHKRSEVLTNGNSMPVLDSEGTANFRPFYDDNTVDDVHMRPKDVETSLAQPTAVVQLKMWDEPESPYPWWFNGDETDPLREFVMNLQFSTYIVARDITGGSLDVGPYVMKILRQWSVILDRRYEFTVVKKTGGGPLRADLTKTKCVVRNPMRNPAVANSSVGFPQNHVAIFQGKVANAVFVDHDAQIAAKSVGEFVKSRAARFGGV